MGQHTLSFSFDDADSAADFNAWFARFIGKLESSGAPMDAAFVQTRMGGGGVTKCVEFGSACDLHRAVNADIAGQVAAMKWRALSCAHS